MSRKARVELSADVVRKAIEDGRPSSLTGLAHGLGYRGSVSSSLTAKFRALVPGIDGLLKQAAGTAEPAKPAKAGKQEPATARPAGKAGGKAKGKPKGKPTAKAGKWPRHPLNPYRAGSYATAFDILAAHKDGLQRERLVEIMAKATGKDARKAGYDAQVVLSARALRPEEEGLNPFESPRNRSARFGYWVAREGDVVRLVLPDSKPDSKPASKAAAAAKVAP